MTQQKKFKIVNTTVKAVRKDPVTGNDVRSASERVGHPVSFLSDKGEIVMVTQSQPRIIDALNEGVLHLSRGGYIRIEEIDDVVTVLKNHVDTSSRSTDLFAPDQAAQVAAPAAKTEDRSAKAKEMGLDNYAQASGKELDGAVNPDGDPNFLVTAPRQPKKKERNNTAEV